ncbi:hypothetical protein KSC_044740 [Ktedonobacter sp. SOSP1-52]|uniref:hypothetical protein n=1 Tax=Ktedonobacter sp. SOSP1-52 TaxID=2778366 RepID=UPI001915F428|nr:hypothetical protein [Ktedonobacter sp. SOSP1-52]GHO65582.1 hypothetical protein KSC_044740 [Ktedonobacter sp. SOSP1-52]
MLAFNGDQPGYEQFYIPAIRKHATGLKLAPGGTGLGKTSVIDKVIHVPDFSQRKFIYFANLKQLVEDVGHFEHSIILHSDRDTVFFTLRDKKQAFYELFHDEAHFRVPILQWNQRHRNMKVDLTKVKRACQAYEEILTEHTSIPSSIEEQMSDHARTIMHCFQAAVLGTKTKRGNNASYLFLLDHPIIQTLFPFIAFKRRPEIRLIALTVQKAYYGFFDGSKKINLGTLTEDDGGYILFLDEFDYLENTLAHLICESAQITNPFHFVQLFFHAMETHKLPHGTYPSSTELREQLILIGQVIKDLREETKLRYPDIYQFTGNIFEDHEKAGNKHPSHVIFRTQHIVRTASQYVLQTERSFELHSGPIAEEEDLEEEEQRKALSALRLFSAVSHASELIIQFFRALRSSNDELVYQEIMRHCFQDTIYPEELERITQYIVPHQAEDGTDLGALLERGYRLYDIYDPQQVTDEEEVEVRHYGMHVTPEVILRSLTKDNLVFGLSATADIPRFVHHFHLDWIHQNITVHEATPDDTILLRELNQRKAGKRGNRITLHIVPELNAIDADQHAISHYIRQVASDEDFGKDSSGYLKHRVELFFSVLLQLCQPSVVEENDANNSQAIDTTLLFFNTFRQIHLLFERYPQPESGIFSITKRSHSNDLDIFEIAIKGRTFLVAFYNAKQGNKMRQLAHVQHAFDQLFWEGKPVVIVTQYKSAAIGINLQYWTSPEKAQRMDFTRIGLLETPYYYFGNPLDEDMTEPERITCLKENIWYLGKLYSGKLISLGQFRQMLTTIHASSSWNSYYHKHARTMYDAHLNSMTNFIQALGRIERIWEKMPDQQALVSREVYQHFQRFCCPEFEQLREDRDAFIPHNLRQILQQVSTALPQKQREARQLKDARLVAQNHYCREAIRPLLTRLEKIRQGNNDLEARQIWQQMRQAVLKHDYSNPVLQHYACVVESPYYQQGMLLLTRENEILPPHILLADTFLWDMNLLYRVIKDNLVISEHFQSQGYRLAFPPAGRHFLTPHCFQAILKGAIGEEAITAILLDEGFALEEIPQILTETADLKVARYPYYFDCKFYNEYTLGRFSLPKEDPEWHIKLNDEAFRESARRKVARLQAQHAEPIKLIYLNLVTTQPRSLGYYDLDFQKANLADASIIVVQGILQGTKPNDYHTAFIRFLRDISQIVPLGKNLAAEAVAE